MHDNEVWCFRGTIVGDFEEKKENYGDGNVCGMTRKHGRSYGFYPNNGSVS